MKRTPCEIEKANVYTYVHGYMYIHMIVYPADKRYIEGHCTEWTANGRHHASQTTDKRKTRRKKWKTNITRNAESEKRGAIEQKKKTREKRDKNPKLMRDGKSGK